MLKHREAEMHMTIDVIRILLDQVSQCQMELLLRQASASALIEKSVEPTVSFSLLGTMLKSRAVVIEFQNHTRHLI